MTVWNLPSLLTGFAIGATVTFVGCSLIGMWLTSRAMQRRREPVSTALGTTDEDEPEPDTEDAEECPFESVSPDAFVEVER